MLYDPLPRKEFTKISRILDMHEGGGLCNVETHFVLEPVHVYVIIYCHSDTCIFKLRIYPVLFSSTHGF